MAHCEVDAGSPYRLPGVGPTRPCTTTFLAQRYELRHPSPAARVDGQPLQLTAQDAEETLQAEMPVVLSSALAFPPPYAIVSLFPSWFAQLSWLTPAWDGLE